MIEFFFLQLKYKKGFFLIYIIFRYFELQFTLAEATGLPLFLHCRQAFPDFLGNSIFRLGILLIGLIYLSFFHDNLFYYNNFKATKNIEIVSRNRTRFTHGVVHSFTGTEEEANAIIDLNLHIGLNGCSLKYPENIQTIRSSIPVDRILLETGMKN